MGGELDVNQVEDLLSPDKGMTEENSHSHRGNLSLTLTGCLWC